MIPLPVFRSAGANSGFFAAECRETSRGDPHAVGCNDARGASAAICIHSKVLALRHTWERLLDFSKNFVQSIVRESALRKCRYLVDDHFI